MCVRNKKLKTGRPPIYNQEQYVAVAAVSDSNPFIKAAGISDRTGIALNIVRAVLRHHKREAA